MKRRCNQRCYHNSLIARKRSPPLPLLVTAGGNYFAVQTFCFVSSAEASYILKPD